MADNVEYSGGKLIDPRSSTPVALDSLSGGALTATSLAVAGNVTTQHDALYAYPADWETNGTPIPENAQDVGLPRVSLADATTQRIKWVWAIPHAGWNTALVRFAWHNETAGAGAVKWQFAYRMIFFNEGDVDQGAMTTVTIPAIAAGGQFDYTYSTPTELENLAIPDVFGIVPVMLCTLSRLGADGTDTLAGAASVSVVTLTRQT